MCFYTRKGVGVFEYADLSTRAPPLHCPVVVPDYVAGVGIISSLRLFVGLNSAYGSKSRLFTENMPIEWCHPHRRLRVTSYVYTRVVPRYPTLVWPLRSNFVNRFRVRSV